MDKRESIGRRNVDGVLRIPHLQSIRRNQAVVDIVADVVVVVGLAWKEGRSRDGRKSRKTMTNWEEGWRLCQRERSGVNGRKRGNGEGEQSWRRW